MTQHVVYIGSRLKANKLPGMLERIAQIFNKDSRVTLPVKQTGSGYLAFKKRV